MSVALIAMGCLLALFVVAAGGILLVVGLVLLLGGYVGLYRRGSRLVDEHTRALATLRPDGRVDFVSRLYVPFYVVPFARGSMLFDGVGGGETRRVGLVNLPLASVESAVTSVAQTASETMEIAQRMPVIGPADLSLLADDAVATQMPEYRLAEALANLGKLTERGSWEFRTLEFTIHPPGGTIASAVGNLAKYATESMGRTVLPARYTMDEALQVVAALRGVEQEAIDADVCNVITGYKSRIEHAVSPVEEMLSSNLQQVEEQHLALREHVGAMSLRQVCKRCLDDRGPTQWGAEYNLEEELLHMFKSNIEAMSPLIQDTIRKDVKEQVNVDLMWIHRGEGKDEIRFPIEAKVSLPNLHRTGKGWICREARHGLVDLFDFPSYSEVFAHTGDNVWRELKEPIREKARATNETATAIRQRFKSHLLALAPYEQTLRQLKVEQHKLSLALQEARSVMATASRGGW